MNHYKQQRVELESKTAVMKETVKKPENTHYNRNSFYYENVVVDFLNIVSNNNDHVVLENSLHAISESLFDESIDLTELLTSNIIETLLSLTSQHTLSVLKILQKIVVFSTIIDDFFKSNINMLNTLLTHPDSDVVKCTLNIISNLVSKSNYEFFLSVIEVLHSKIIQIVTTIETTQYLYSIIPFIKQNEEIIKIDDINRMLFQIIIHNNQDIVLMGLKIIKSIININVQKLVETFDNFQIQFESLLYSKEVRKIAVGYELLAVTVKFCRSKEEIIKDSEDIFSLAQDHIDSVIPFLKKSVILYICEFVKFTHYCIPIKLLEKVVNLADGNGNHNFSVCQSAANCLALCVGLTKCRLVGDSIERVLLIFSSFMNSNNDTIFNIFEAMNVILTVMENTDQVELFMSLMSNFNFDELIENENEFIANTSKAFIDRLNCDS